MKHLFLAMCMVAMTLPAFSQEFYVNTEPANNLAKDALDIRLQNQGYFGPGYKSRNSLSVAYGVTQLLVIQGSAYESNLYQGQQHFEGGSVYAKYRFLSIDSVQTHFRGAFFTRLSNINNPVVNQEITLEGDNSGVQSGVVFSQLLHKIAFSGSASYLRAFDNSENHRLPAGNPRNAIAYNLSAGYLLLPKTLTSYKQLNLSLYAELLGKANPGYGQSYLDAAPAVQLIFNSLFRVDFSYRVPLYNDMLRNSPNTFLIGLEYKLYNL
jgi:hypothetical protein